MMNTEERIKNQLGFTRPVWEHPDQVFWVSIQLFKNYGKRKSYTIHKKFSCRWDNLPAMLAHYIDIQNPPVQTFWIIGVTRIKPEGSWLHLFSKEKHR